MSNGYNNNYNTPSPGPGPGNYGPNRSGNNGGNSDLVETLSWIIDIGLIFVWFPVGLFLTIANASGRNFVGSIIRSIMKNSKSSGGGTATSRSANTYYDVGQNRTASSRVGQKPPQASAPQTGRDGAGVQGDYSQPGVGTAQKTAKAAAKKGGDLPKDTGASILEVAGWIVGVLGLVMTLGSLGDGIWSVLSSLALVLGGGALIFSGWKRKQKEKAFKRCFTVSGHTGIVKIKNLANTLGVGEAELEKQLQEMIDRGYYGERAYLDHARGLLVIEPEQMRDVYKAEDEARAAGKEAQARQAAASARTEYEKIIAEIRQADEDIADEVMSEKIRTMQEITAAIFQEVEAHPAKKPQIQRFMNYYLPTTLKLLDSYARIEQQGVSGENMAKAKADIERIADTLVEGYKKQLDTLYRSEAVDIAGDVSVIENMMRRDGLTGQDDFRVNTSRRETAASADSGQGASAAAQEGQVLGGH